MQIIGLFGMLIVLVIPVIIVYFIIYFAVKNAIVDANRELAGQKSQSSYTSL